jgi:hypothetical protein
MRGMRRLLTAVLLVVLCIAAPAMAMTRTTTDRTIQDTDGDNRLEPAPGEDYGAPRQELGTPSATRARTRQRLIFFGQMTDTHVVDEESPLRVEFLDKFKGPFTSAYRPHEGVSAQVLSEMAEQLRNTTSPVSPSKQIQLVMTTGDNTDNTQCNETRWMIDVLDGNTTVTPDSGLLAGQMPGSSGCAVSPAPAVPTPPACTARATPDDRYDGPRGGHEYYEANSSAGEDGQGYSPRQAENIRSSEVRDFPGLFQEMNEPFRPTGLQKLPWYAVFGNHDGLIQGNQPRNLALEALAVGCVKPTNLPTLTVQDILGHIQAGDPELGLKVLQDALVAASNGTLPDASTTVVPPDPRRRPLRKHEWIAEHFATSGYPAGHGFNFRPASLVDGQGYYHFEPAPRVRFIALDTISEAGLEEGNIDDTQFRWLHDRLHEADEQQHYSILFAHHSLRTMGQPPVSPFADTADQGGDHSPLVHYGLRTRAETADRPCLLHDNETPPYPDETLKCLLLRHPSAVAFVNGHEHANRLTPFARDPQAGPAEGGFWEINTASHIDWPQQSRVIDVFDNHDGTLSLFGTIVDHSAPPNPGAPDAPRAGQGMSGSSPQRMASISRELAFNDPDATHNDSNGDGGGRGSRADRNQELVVRDPFAP